MRSYFLRGLALLTVVGCSSNNHSTGGRQATVATATTIAPGAADAQARLAASPRHGEWVIVKTGPADSTRAWLVYPERKDKAPVVVVVHEIFALSNWVRSVADQLAADGFIAIAPDLLTMKNIPNTANGEPNPDSANAKIRTLNQADVQRQIRKVAEYAMALPAAQKKYGVVGFCWGGGVVFAHAVSYPDVNAVVSYYGTTPATAAEYAKVKAPVLELYGGSDARVGATIPRADSASRTYHFTYEPHSFEGAGHGFLRGQDGQNGANLKAAQQAWPMTVAWFRKYLK